MNNPFTVLGLPTDPDVSDEQVRAAWRAIAAATHPDRPDGGNVTRYTAAANAYAQLRTAWGRKRGLRRPDRRPARPRSPRTGHGYEANSVRACWGWPCCSRPASGTDGPATLLFRALLTALLSLAVVNLLPGQPSGPAVVTGLVTWFVLTARGDLAPPPGR